MNKEEIISILKKYNFDADEYIVLSTGAMTLHGIKDIAHDIDLAVSEKLYNELLETYECTLKCEYMVNGKKMKVYSFDVFDFSTNCFDKNNVDVIEGIPIQNVNSILKLKQSLNRDKDINDINPVPLCWTKYKYVVISRYYI
ncbi:MAG: hypothetical protein HFH47_03740, partial [Bacilli bacterium]|nr:hypothetical protein [Bacilli bacterium]